MCRLRLEDQAFVLLSRVPQRFDIAQGSGLCTKLKWMFRRSVEETRDGLPNLIERSAAEAAAEKF